jgi:hypothetical protein
MSHGYFNLISLIIFSIAVAITNLPLMLVIGIFILIFTLNLKANHFDLTKISGGFENFNETFQTSDITFQLLICLFILIFIKLSGTIFEKVIFENGEKYNNIQAKSSLISIFQIGLIYTILDSKHFISFISGNYLKSISIFNSIISFFSYSIILGLSICLGFNIIVFSASCLSEKKQFFIEKVLNKIGISILVLILFSFFLKSISENSLNELIF